MLYANENLAAFLRKHVVLHWKTIREAPEITIQFDNGRKIHKTILGNITHHVLRQDGTPIHSIPGLMAPSYFRKNLEKALSLRNTLQDEQANGNHVSRLKEFHRSRYENLVRTWRTDLKRVDADGDLIQTDLPAELPGTSGKKGDPKRATRVTASKMAVETPTMKAIYGPDVIDSLRSGTSRARWRKIGSLHEQRTRLGPRSRTLVRRYAEQRCRKENGTCPKHGDPEKQIRRLESRLAVDALRNHYQFQLQIHRWFIKDARTWSLDKLDRRIFGDLYSTPPSDPYLGLRSTNMYSGYLPQKK